MSILIAGASGATGRLLVEQLLNSDKNVKVIVRQGSSLPEKISNHKNLTIITGSILEFNDEELSNHLKECDAIASCLGHNLTFKGMFGRPRKLVRDAVKRLCGATVNNNPDKPVKFILMNTAGNRNPALNEKVSLGHKLILGVVRILVPPQSDNEKAADYLQRNIGEKNKFIKWSIVRPDSLIDEEDVTEYEVYESPVRSAITDPGKTSRINVAHFMADLISDENIWQKWKYKMPVIYNKGFGK